MTDGLTLTGMCFWGGRWERRRGSWEWGEGLAAADCEGTHTLNDASQLWVQGP